MPFHHVKVAQRNELLIIDFSACRNDTSFFCLFCFVQMENVTVFLIKLKWLML